VRGLSLSRSRPSRAWAASWRTWSPPNSCARQSRPTSSTSNFSGFCSSERRRTHGHPALEQLSLVPKDRQCDQSDRNNPQNDVFAAALFLGHGGSTTHPKSGFKCLLKSLSRGGESGPGRIRPGYGFVATRWQPVNFTIFNARISKFAMHKTIASSHASDH
jgi:hypothetical protein